MNQVGHRKNNSMLPSLDEIHKLSQMCAVLGTCPFYTKIGPGGVLAIWLTALELGLPPMSALNGGLYTFDGKVTMSAQLMNMMIVNAGHQANVVYLDDTGCKIRFIRSDRKGESAVFEYEFNLDHAKKAGYFGTFGPKGEVIYKPKDNWVKHSRDMFFSRCLSGGARKFMPDVLMSSYVFGEIEGAEPEGTPNPLPAAGLQEVPRISNELIENFKIKYGIGNDSDHDRYIKVLCNKFKKTEDEMIFSAISNEEKFLSAYQGWLDKLPKPEIMESNNSESP